MKHKYYLLAVLLLLTSIPSFAQLDCGDIDLICEKSQELMNQGEYEKALNGLQKAKQLPGIRNCSSVSKIDNMIRRIQNRNSSNKSSYVPQTQRFFVNGVSFTMIAVEGGTFTMGATSEQNSPEKDERPALEVTLTRFCIGETEVTQALWKAVMGSNPSFFDGDELPVEMVSWEDCQLFLKILNAVTIGQRPNGREFRMPTEAEWEFAARGGNKSKHTQYAGSHNLSSVAWYSDNSDSKTHSVKQKQPNELGLYDMSGNVTEWCQDWYDENYYIRSSSKNPSNVIKTSERVCRGGCWDVSAMFSRVAGRGSMFPEEGTRGLGLRLAL